MRFTSGFLTVQYSKHHSLCLNGRYSCEVVQALSNLISNFYITFLFSVRGGGYIKDFVTVQAEREKQHILQHGIQILQD